MLFFFKQKKKQQIKNVRTGELGLEVAGQAACARDHVRVRHGRSGSSGQEGVRQEAECVTSKRLWLDYSFLFSVWRPFPVPFSRRLCCAFVIFLFLCFFLQLFS